MMHSINPAALALNLLCHLAIFVGTFYVILHSKNLPKWHITPLWWAGLSCLLTALSIIMGYAFGDDFPMAYVHIGTYGETALNICLAVIAVSFIVSTAKKTRIKRSK